MKKIEVVIPAYNEEDRLPKVIEVLQRTKEVGKIIVVDDGSTDQTIKQAAELGVTVLRHQKNKGKGAALKTGIKETTKNPLMIIDADLKNLRPDHITTLINLFYNQEDCDIKTNPETKKGKGETVLVNGVVDRGQASNLTEKIEEALTGLRIMDRKVWDNTLKELSEDGYSVDYLIYVTAKKLGKIKTKTLPGLEHYKKTEKNGFIKGSFNYVKMFLQITYETIASKISKIKKAL